MTRFGGPHINRVAAAWALLLGAIIVAFVMAIDGMPGRDSSVFVYVADGLLGGEVPYADRWDHKGPLIYVIDSVGRIATPDSFTGIRILEVIALAAWVWLGFLALRPAFGAQAAIFGIAIAAVAATALADGGNMTEEWALLPQFGALYLFTRVQRSESDPAGSRRLLLTIGALGALAFLLRPNLIGIWLAIGACWMVWDSQRWYKLTWAAIGGATSLAVAGLLIAAAGLWPAFLDAVFAFNAAYTSIEGLGAQIVRFIETWLRVPMAIPATLLWLGAIKASWRPSGRPAAMTTLARLAALLWPIDVLMISIGGRDYVHYLLTILPAMAILMSFGAELVLAGSESLISRRTPSDTPGPRRVAGVVSPAALLLTIAAVWFAVMALAPALGVYEPVGLVVREGAESDDARIRAARLVSARTTQDDSVLVWGSEAQVYLLSGRSAPSRYFYQVPLVTDGYANEGLATEFVADIEREMPKIIIDARHGCLPPLDPMLRRSWRPRCNAPTVIPDAFDGFFQLVERDYRPGLPVGEWAIFELDDD